MRAAGRRLCSAWCERTRSSANTAWLSHSRPHTPLNSTPHTTAGSADTHGYLRLPPLLPTVIQFQTVRTATRLPLLLVGGPHLGGGGTKHGTKTAWKDTLGRAACQGTPRQMPISVGGTPPRPGLMTLRVKGTSPGSQARTSAGQRRHKLGKNCVIVAFLWQPFQKLRTGCWPSAGPPC